MVVAEAARRSCRAFLRVLRRKRGNNEARLRRRKAEETRRQVIAPMSPLNSTPWKQTVDFSNFARDCAFADSSDVDSRVESRTVETASQLAILVTLFEEIKVVAVDFRFGEEEESHATLAETPLASLMRNAPQRHEVSNVIFAFSHMGATHVVTVRTGRINEQFWSAMQQIFSTDEFCVVCVASKRMRQLLSLMGVTVSCDMRDPELVAHSVNFASDSDDITALAEPLRGLRRLQCAAATIPAACCLENAVSHVLACMEMRGIERQGRSMQWHIRLLRMQAHHFRRRAKWAAHECASQFKHLEAWSEFLLDVGTSIAQETKAKAKANEASETKSSEAKEASEAKSSERAAKRRRIDGVFSFLAAESDESENESKSESKSKSEGESGSKSQSESESDVAVGRNIKCRDLRTGLSVASPQAVARFLRLAHASHCITLKPTDLAKLRTAPASLLKRLLPRIQHDHVRTVIECTLAYRRHVRLCQRGDDIVRNSRLLQETDQD
ncbi:MAG: hypothetical protein MHM6MM_008927, partial [Cercozoa sp. M6MM]